MNVHPAQMALPDFLPVARPAEKLPCPCRCGKTPKLKKSRFLPGHDTRYYVRFAKEHGADEVPH